MSGDDWKLKAAQHFLNNRSPEKLREIPVPEWGKTIYYFPVRSIEEDRAIKIAQQHGVKIGADENSFRVDVDRAMVTELIARARDEHARRLFADGEFEWITKNLDLDVLTRVVMAMEDDHPSADPKK